jgi:pimeloyl-ACP methyl ester carboxylesterase
MNIEIQHLPGIDAQIVRTARLQTRVLFAGSETGTPVIFLHGNVAAATFWEETMLALPEQFRAVAPDQRGFGLSDTDAHIDATRGFADWADDVIALADSFGWQRFHVVGHSLGGCIGWSLIGTHPQRLQSVTLVSPGPPCGFPGAHGQRGELNFEDGAGSGGGLTHSRFVEQLRAGDRELTDEFFSPRAVMNRVLWQPPFRPAREEDLLTAMLQIHLGEHHFPGDWQPSANWPGFAPGRFGPVNALSPKYNQHVLDQLTGAQQKPPLLWIYGTSDAIISDASLSDLGQQGKLGLRPDWPGGEIFPPQPLLTQVRFALDRYEQTGGTVERLVLPDVGHTPFLEAPEKVHEAIVCHLQQHHFDGDQATQQA